MEASPISDNDYLQTIQNAQETLELFKNKRVFITGGTGFFGKWLVQILAGANRDLKLNLSLTVLCRNPKQSLIEQPWLNDSCIHLFAGDVRNFDLLNQSFDIFIHGATAASALINHTQPETMADTIIAGTKRVLLQAELSSKPRFLCISSGAIYGTQDPQISHFSEHGNSGPDITKAANAYAEAKRMAELYCQFSQDQQKISLSVARCFSFVGPYLPLNEHFAAGNFIGDTLNSKAVTLSGNGAPFRSYMYPTDLVEWLLTILMKASQGSVYNVGSDEEIQLGTLAKLIDGGRFGVQVLGKEDPYAKKNAYVPSIEKAKSELGLKVRVELNDAIERTLLWHKNLKQEV